MSNDLNIESLLELKRKFEQIENKNLKDMGTLFGLHIQIDYSMPKDQWKIVAGEEAFMKMVAHLPYLKESK